MNNLRRLLATSAAAIVALASGALVAHADTTPTVYNTPGKHVSGDRLWDTACEMYSTNVVRCRTEIWATQVQYISGRYVSVTGWTFNNLTYLPAPRASWAGNNLARNNDGWNSGGRKWRTECDTATTGRGGCRSYVWTKQTHPEGGRYVSRHGWVFNNIVLFSSSAVSAVSAVPSGTLYLDFPGLVYKTPGGVVPSPVVHGASMTDLGILGYFRWQTDPMCDSWVPSQRLENWGVFGEPRGDRLDDVTVDKPGIWTVDGAQVGMTFNEVKDVYGSRLRPVEKDTQGSQPVHVAVVESGGSELVFLSSLELRRPLKDSDKITMMMARESVDYIVGSSGC